MIEILKRSVRVLKNDLVIPWPALAHTTQAVNR